MRQYCSVCKDHLDMTVVSDTNEDGVIWLKCPRCKGILPRMEDAPPSVAAEPMGPASLEELDLSRARIYDPSEVYAVGDVVHHRGWDDYGTVTAKATLPGNRQIIRVRFVEHGEMQLIEGAP